MSTTSISATLLLLHHYDSRVEGAHICRGPVSATTMATLSTAGTGGDLRMERENKTVRREASRVVAGRRERVSLAHDEDFFLGEDAFFISSSE